MWETFISSHHPPITKWIYHSCLKGAPTSDINFFTTNESGKCQMYQPHIYSRWHSLETLKWYSSDHTLKKSVAVRWYTGGLGEVPVEERPVVLTLLRQSSPISSNTTTSPPVTRGGLTPAECWCRTTDLTSVENTVSVTSRCWELSPRLFFASFPHLPYRNQH